MLVGVVEVAVDDRPTGTLGPGEAFGEIALLRDVSRTATVRARTLVVLQVLHRDDFLRAVGDPVAQASYDRVVDERHERASPAPRRGS